MEKQILYLVNTGTEIVETFEENAKKTYQYLWVSLLIYLIGSMIDGISTYIGLENGFVEKNEFWRKMFEIFGANPLLVILAVDMAVAGAIMLFSVALLTIVQTMFKIIKTIQRKNTEEKGKTTPVGRPSLSMAFMEKSTTTKILMFFSFLTIIYGISRGIIGLVNLVLILAYATAGKTTFYTVIFMSVLTTAFLAYTIVKLILKDGIGVKKTLIPTPSEELMKQINNACEDVYEYFNTNNPTTTTKSDNKKPRTNTYRKNTERKYLETDIAFCDLISTATEKKHNSHDNTNDAYVGSIQSEPF